MPGKILIAFWLLTLPAFAGADSQWVLDRSTLTYHVSHPLHQSEGVSHEARGKGVCHEGQCDFLIAVPVRSFDSRDSNRDLHMLQVTRGAQFPLVTVRTRLPESASPSATIYLDLEIQFIIDDFSRAAFISPESQETNDGENGQRNGIQSPPKGYKRKKRSQYNQYDA